GRKFHDAADRVQKAGYAGAHGGDPVPAVLRFFDAPARAAGGVLQDALRSLAALRGSFHGVQQPAFAVADAGLDRGPPDVQAEIKLFRHVGTSISLRLACSDCFAPSGSPGRVPLLN